ncbi:HNH endonuclease [Actinoplanes auranticolor]|uniref:HNH endonuclease n=1 Tax=Actinoplanes auranticolor TaxID=47988 RepID=A0A919SV81_9ACTN|nr:hypothetical protein [Actinoplanes auranticolor]GIM78599.1 HNH endonuclease [Actinoplanes auranticolor]
MYAIPKPRRSATDDYDAARKLRRSKVVKSRLEAVRERVLEAYVEYDKKRGLPSLVSELNLDVETADALLKNYRLTYVGNSLDSIRGDLMASTLHGLCPMCGRGEVWTLDHYLPKESYPEFSLLPINLVPACWSCNHFKAKLTESLAGARFFHTYYDSLPTMPILKAAIVFDQGSFDAVFDVNPVLPDETLHNASFQFEKLRLSRLYKLASKVELVERYHAVDNAYGSGGAEEVAYLARMEARQLRESFGDHYWKVALYEGIAGSHDFCDGGYRLL